VTTADSLLSREVHIVSSPGPSAVCEALRAKGVRACCLDDTGADPRPLASTSSFVTVRDALAGITAERPRYRWEIAYPDLVNVYPVDSVIENDAPPLHIAGKGLWVVLEEDLPLRNWDITLFVEFKAGDGPPVFVDLEGASIRAALSACIGQVRGAVWHISGTPDNYVLSVSDVV
jgi:hypothetical protein